MWQLLNRWMEVQCRHLLKLLYPTASIRWLSLQNSQGWSLFLTGLEIRSLKKMAAGLMLFRTIPCLTPSLGGGTLGSLADITSLICMLYQRYMESLLPSHISFFTVSCFSSSTKDSLWNPKILNSSNLILNFTTAKTFSLIKSHTQTHREIYISEDI